MLANLWIEVDNAPEISQATTNDSPIDGAFHIVGKVARVADIFEIELSLRISTLIHAVRDPIFT